MNVNSLTSTYDVSTLDPLQSTQTQGASDPTAPGSTSNGVSSFASLMNSLQQLQQSDPDKFKQVMTSVSSTLQTDAANATGSQAQFLSQLAGKFQQAAQTGSLSPLQPPGGASGHHGHHHHGVKSYAAQPPAGSSDPTQQSPFDLAQVIQSAMQQASAT